MAQVEEYMIQEKNAAVDYKRIHASDAFTQLVNDKKKFMVSNTIFYMIYSLLLPVIAFYTDVLNRPAFGDITWAWVYGVSFIPVSLLICSHYVKRSAQFDQRAKDIMEKEGL